MKATIKIIRSDLTHAKGLGDAISAFAKPVAKVLRVPCLDEKNQLKPDSPCKKGADFFNALVPFNN